MPDKAVVPFLADIDLNLNELQNAVIEKVSGVSTTDGVVGQVVYDTTDGCIKVCTRSYDNTTTPVTTALWQRVVDATYTATTSRAGLVELATDAEVTTGTDTSRYMSVKQIKDEIASAVAGGMHFKGTAAANAEEGVKTGNPYNPASKAIGDEYKVIAGTGNNVELTVLIAANTKDNAKIGDTVICTDATNNYWTIIPSGDEPSGTVTSITVTTPTGLKVNSGTSAEITTSGTFALTVDSANGYEIPTTAHVKNYGQISDGTNTTSANDYNDTISFAAAGGASVGVSGDTVTFTQTDKKVEQKKSTTNSAFPVLLKKSANATDETAETNYGENLKYNPSTDTLAAGYFSGDGSNLTNVTPASHTHGNITNDGKITTTSQASDVTPASSDKMVITDNSDSNKVVRSSIAATDVVDAVTKKHSHSDITLSLTAQTYDGSHTIAMPASDPYTSARTPSSHTHGNIQNGGTLQTTDVAIANGDKLVVTDASDSNKVARTSLSFDASSTDKILSKKGTWIDYNKSAIESLLGSTSTHAVAYKETYTNPASTGSTLTGGVFTWTIQHGLDNSGDVTCIVKDVATGKEVMCEVVYGTTTSGTSTVGTVTIKMNTTASSIAASTYKAVIIG